MFVSGVIHPKYAYARSGHTRALHNSMTRRVQHAALGGLVISVRDIMPDNELPVSEIAPPLSCAPHVLVACSPPEYGMHELDTQLSKTNSDSCVSQATRVARAARRSRVVYTAVHRRATSVPHPTGPCAYKPRHAKF